MQAEEVPRLQTGRQQVWRYISQCNPKRYQACDLEGQRVRRYRSECKLKWYEACEQEGSECGVKEGNESSSGAKLANWKAASAALEKSMHAEEVHR